MSDKKIKVPEEMLRIAIVAFNEDATRSGYKYVVDRYLMERVMSLALRWFDNELNELEADYKRSITSTYCADSNNDAYVSQGFKICLDRIRRMFLEPEQRPFVREFVDDLRGRTFTEAEANAMISVIRMGTEPK